MPRTNKPKIEIAPVDPLLPEVLEMIAALDALMRELYPIESAHLTDPAKLADAANRFYGARVDGRILGCGGFLVTQGYGEVKRIYVSPRARGLGLGRAVMGHLEQEARALGLERLKLETGIHQPEALGLFEVCGYAVCERFGDYPEGDPNSVFYEKVL
jgi:putative acetyltransferase